MIRNVVMGRLPADAGEEQQRQLDEGLAGIAALQLPGQLAMTVGRDAGLRPGGWTFAITNDWIDASAYRDYDLDAGHNHYRTIVGEVCEQLARVQFEF